MALLLLACSSRLDPPSVPIYGFKPMPAEFDLGDASPFERRAIRIDSDGESRLLVTYEKFDPATGEKIGDFFKLSTDSGASFGPERTLPHLLLHSGAVRFAFFKGGLTAVYMPARQSNLFYTRSWTEGATWSEPVQINDELESVAMGGGGDFSFVQPSEREIYCLWTDRRRGFWLTYFSASRDGGRTWTPNQPVDYDFREGRQTLPQLVVGAGGRLLAFWTDERDRQTLFDVRCSYSDDGGQHWSPSQKINDDGAYAWQTLAGVTARGDQIYAIFQDHRGLEEEKESTPHLYFARSVDNGETWSENVRVNDVTDGVVNYAHLASDERGILYCVWQSGHASILGHVYVADSTDGGQSWSRSIRVDEGDELRLRTPWPLISSGGQRLCSWVESRPGWQAPRFAWLEPLTEPPAPEAPAPAIEPPSPPAFNEGEQLFADDFSSENYARWQAATGVWTVVDGAVMGVEPGALDISSLFARFKEPERYILRGRFKLDPVHHRMASLYFRAHPATQRYYVIGNGFQTGVCLSIKEDNALPLVFGPFALVGRPLAQRRFPFRNNRWYEFMLVVTPERVDYSVDGQWMLSYEGELQLPPGRIGIGSFGAAPTYFDNLAVYESNSSARRHEGTVRGASATWVAPERAPGRGSGR